MLNRKHRLAIGRLFSPYKANYNYIELSGIIAVNSVTRMLIINIKVKNN
jgi:hypothetical protein